VPKTDRWLVTRPPEPVHVYIRNAKRFAADLLPCTQPGILCPSVTGFLCSNSDGPHHRKSLMENPAILLPATLPCPALISREARYTLQSSIWPRRLLLLVHLMAASRGLRENLLGNRQWIFSRCIRCLSSFGVPTEQNPSQYGSVPLPSFHMWHKWHGKEVCFRAYA
jgi:hypothetical protein